MVRKSRRFGRGNGLKGYKKLDIFVRSDIIALVSGNFSLRSDIIALVSGNFSSNYNINNFAYFDDVLSISSVEGEGIQKLNDN